ncbi:response regulator transcription factor [Amycolatopsis sp. WAC 01376]|uniref:response regulator transcription factor n=1 Tax=Amycolatopsis sp. WAC 01376 TaxID=2203195 RepID=UPI001315A4B5|nr:response regulator transcription factor [Amycolatopsis sp. WAC 01376]
MAEARSARRCVNSVAGHACQRPAKFVVTVDGREVRTCGICRELVMAFLTRQGATATTVDVEPFDRPSARRASAPVAHDSRSHGRILVLEDDDNLRGIVARELRARGYEVTEEGDLPAVDERVRTDPPDLLLLDRIVPSGDSLNWVRHVRAYGNAIPVVILTARDSLGDRLQGFERHVDDYIVKPFSMPDLATRVGRVLRRSRPDSPTEQTYTDSFVHLDFQAGELRVSGIAVPLTRQEFRFLEVLVRNAGAIQSREKIARALWDKKPSSMSSLDVVAHRLRQKLKPTDLGESPIVAARGRGYLYQVPATSAGQATQLLARHSGYGHAGRALDILNAHERQETHSEIPDQD